jgi:nucleotide-binding universal stress UspA family protein
MKRLLVGYDGSEHAREAVRLAAYLARRSGAGLTVLSVEPAPAIGRPPRPPWAADAARETARDGAALAESHGVRAAARGAHGPPADVLVDIAGRGGYDLLVLGHGGTRSLVQMVVGSVAKRVAAEAPCPVLVVRDAVPAAIDHVLVGVTRSASSQRAAEAAVALARACGARLTLLHVIDTALLAATARAQTMAHLHVAEEADGKAALVWMSQLCQKAGVPDETVQATGQPAEVLLSIARERGAQVVAIGRPQRPGVERVVLGSESDAILRYVESAVLITGQRAAAPVAGGITGRRAEPATGALAGTAVGAPAGGVGVLDAARGAAAARAVKPAGGVAWPPAA